MHPIARWLLFLASFVLVLLALVQVAGRALMPWLAAAESQINTLLEPQGIRIEGLDGRWVMLNPVITARRVSLPAGDLLDLSVQPDLLESAWRSGLVLRRARVEDGHVALARDAQGWWLAGMKRGGGDTPDLSALLLESDELAANLSVTVLGATPGTVRIAVSAINRGGRNRLELKATRPDAAAAHLHLRAERSRAIPWLRPAGHRGQVTVRAFGIPEPLVGGGRVHLGRIDGAWMVDDGTGRGELRLDDLDLALGGSRPFQVSSVLRVWSAGWDWGVRGDLTVASEGLTTTVRDLVALKRPARVDVHVAHLDMDEMLGVARVVAAPLEKIDRWLTGLNAGGQLRNVWGFLNTDASSAAGWRFGYGAQLLDGRTDGFNGVPRAAGADAEVVGYDHGFRVSVMQDSLRLGFPELFARDWDAREVSGDVQVFFRPGYSAVRGERLSANTGSVVASGSFVVTNPELAARKALVLLVDADAADFADARGFIPRNLEPKLLEWLDAAPRAGQLSAIRFALQSQNKAAGIEFARRVEIRSEVREMAVAYHPDWPMLEGLEGTVELRGNDVTFNARKGRSGAIVIDGSTVDVIRRGGEAQVSVISRADAADYLDFIRTSPLAAQMRFIRPEWRLAGAMSVEGSIAVPLRNEPGQDRPATAALRGNLRGVRMDLPDLRLEFSELAGSFDFATPHAVSASGITGSLWGEPVTIGAEPGDGQVRILAEGELTTDRALMIAGLAPTRFARGRFGYQADIGIAVAPGASTEINVRSELTGVDLDLPESLGRTAADSTPSTLGVQLLGDYSVVAFQYRDVQGWLHVGDRPMRGAIGIGSAPPMIDSGDTFVSIGGRLRHVHLESWTRLFDREDDPAAPEGGAGGDAAAGAVGFDWRIDGLAIDRAFVGDLGFDGVHLDALGSRGITRFDFDADDISGHVVLKPRAPVQLAVERVRLPADPKAPLTPETALSLRRKLGPKPDDDPLPESLIERLVDMDVTIGRIWRGEEDFGTWQFSLRKPEPGVMAISALEAQLKGLRIRAQDGVRWTAVDDLTAFRGSIAMDNLAEVLPQWRYAASVASESAELDADVVWAGSPLNIGVANMAGTIGFTARNGRFLEVESGSGAMRIMSLFSFSAILKRLNFNFSDVIGRGVGFETLATRIELGNGLLTFVQPMEVRSTSSDFRLGGTVNMHTGALANELIVTLPVSKNLPWYGVYIALANPLVGLGVIVGERVLRKPLEQFSSAKYEVRGTLAEPDVKFVELFDTRLSVPVAVTPVPGAVPAPGADGPGGDASGDDEDRGDAHDSGDADDSGDGHGDGSATGTQTLVTESEE